MVIISIILARGEEMLGLRYESYGEEFEKLPFSLTADLKRTPDICSREQNWHENLEIQLCKEGEGEAYIDGERYEIKKGDLVLVNSNAIHYTATKSLLYYTCIIISTKWCEEMNIPYESLKLSPHIKSFSAERLIGELEKAYEDLNLPFRNLKLNEIFLRLMTEIFENHSSKSFSPEKRGRRFNVIKETIVYIRNNYSRKLSLQEISEAVYYDKYNLCKEFKRYTGKTVFEYLNEYRAQVAKDFLYNGYNVSETAALCGFEDASFFNKVFKRYMGKSPSFYKK